MSMEMFLAMIADFVAAFAEVGAGFRSFGIGYQPEVPEELL